MLPATNNKRPQIVDTAKAGKSNGPFRTAARKLTTSPCTGLSRSNERVCGPNTSKSCRKTAGVANIHSCSVKGTTYLKSRYATVSADNSTPRLDANSMITRAITGAAANDQLGRNPKQGMRTRNKAKAIAKSTVADTTALNGTSNRGK